jgi:CubicO group peptidase (beta-lactamase class C family)
MIKKNLAQLLLLWCLTSCGVAQEQNATVEQRFDALIEQGLKDAPLPGIAIGIVQHGQLVYARGFGAQRLGDPAKPVTPRTLFHMASITKTFVATSVMQLWELGKVDLDAPITKYVPYFRIDDTRYVKITVRQMLSHSSGMPDVEDYEWNRPQDDDGALERYVRSLAGMKLRLLFDPGTSFSYSNMAYEVLGDLIAKVSGRTFEDYVEANILRPLSMNDSALLLKKADSALLAQGYTRLDDNDHAGLRQVAAYPFNRIHSPSSDLMSNITDMAHWAVVNLNLGELDGKRILKRSTYDLMWKPTVDVVSCRDPERKNCQKGSRQVGISWFLQKRTGTNIIFHNGEDDGFMARFILVPEANMALIWMCNYDDERETLTDKIEGEFFKFVKEASERN